VGTTPLAQELLEQAYAQIGATSFGQVMENALEDSSVNYLITNIFATEQFPGQYLGNINTISIDPFAQITVHDPCNNPLDSPLPVNLGHEMGHARSLEPRRISAQ